MAIICPTITTETPQEFAAQLAKVTPFTPRLHIDVAAPPFAPRQLLPLAQIYLPEDVQCDVHVMLQEPMAELLTLISLKPQLVVLHAEAADVEAVMTELQKVQIKVGVALLPPTEVRGAAALLAKADHALIFAGHLGYQGGTADMSQLKKVPEIRALNPKIEIAWDGGVNDQTAAQLVAGGIDVLNVGGFIQKAADPQEAYRQLTAIVATAERADIGDQ